MTSYGAAQEPRVPRLSLTAVGVDRPGIVAAVTGALVDVGCNLADSTMAILQGQFAMLLIVEAGDATAEQIEAALARRAAGFELTVAVRPVTPAGDRAMRPVKPVGDRAGLPGSDAHADTHTEPGADDQATEAASLEPWVISVHGADRPGIVHAVAAALAGFGGNIVDLVTHTVGSASEPLYTMTLRASLPGGRSEQAAEAVRSAARQLGVHCSIHRDDADIL